MNPLRLTESTEKQTSLRPAFTVAWAEAPTSPGPGTTASGVIMRPPRTGRPASDVRGAARTSSVLQATSANVRNDRMGDLEVLLRNGPRAFEQCASSAAPAKFHP